MSRHSRRAGRRRSYARPWLELLEGRRLPSTFTVLNTGDGGPGSLRQAILDANSHANSLNPGGAADLIQFNLVGTGVRTISPTSALPTISDPVILDGWSQGGAGYSGAPL